MRDVRVAAAWLGGVVITVAEHKRFSFLRWHKKPCHTTSVANPTAGVRRARKPRQERPLPTCRYHDADKRVPNRKSLPSTKI